MDKINPNQYIVIGTKPREAYFQPILEKLCSFEFIILKTYANPSILSTISYIYEFLRFFGIKEIPPRKYINEEGKGRVMLIRWEIIPQLKFYREVINSEIKEEKEYGG